MNLFLQSGQPSVIGIFFISLQLCLMFTLNILAFDICCLMGIGFHFCNSMLEVRESAGQAFSTLYKVLLCVS